MLNGRRPSERAYARLPVMEARRHELETCVYCPKLCRTSCAVSNAEPRETLTPWGKMSSAYFMARGDVEIDAGFAKTAWACTACGACEDFCHHHNPVASTLYEARAALFDKGMAPAEAVRVTSEFTAWNAALARRVSSLNAQFGAPPDHARIILFAGCTHGDKAVEDALFLVGQLLGEPVTLAPTCCGERLRAAGDRKAFASQRAKVDQLLRAYERAFVLDPICHASIQSGGGRALETTTVTSLLARHLDRFRPQSSEPPRQHDVARDESVARRVLLRLFGAKPREFETRGGVATGGLLPVTMPHVAKAIGMERAAEHARLGGGVLCTSSGEEASFLRDLGVDARDFVSIARSALQ